MQILNRLIPETLRSTLYLRYFGFSKIPLLFYVRPSVVEKSDQHVVIRIPLNRRTKNHHGSMYFAALSIGADCSVGLLAVELIKLREEKIHFIFRDFNAEFYRRAHADVYFRCDQGKEITALVENAIANKQRVEMPLYATATAPDENDEPVARFRLTLSLKQADA
ncbi:MAG: DUF4442 domain-containing protein [Thiotrichales bacterium]|nr:MAG: DUF4442 domain-containing protein [Thiotrichales bacterium]